MADKPLRYVIASFALIVTVWFLWPQLFTLLFSALMAFTFYPLYKKLQRGDKHSTFAALVTLAISFLVFIIPIGFITIAAISQLWQFSNYVAHTNFTSQLPDIIDTTINQFNSLVASLTGSASDLSSQSVFSYLRDTMPGVLRNLANIALGMLSSLPGVSVALLIYTFSFYEFLKNGPSLVTKIKQISPLSRSDTDKYFRRIGLMATAMMKGQLFIAFISAFIAVLPMIALGYGDYFFILLVVCTVLNFIPLGSGILLVPLIIYSMLTGHLGWGIAAFIVYTLSGNLDPILRPRFIPKEIELSATWSMVSAFCGIAYFGILGVVYGPIIMIVIITTWGLFIRHRQIPKHRLT